MNNIINKLKNKKIAILGFGKEGRSTYNYIRKYDTSLKLTILDAKDITLEDNNITIKMFRFIFNFWRNFHNCFPYQLHHFTVLLRGLQSLSFSTSSSTLVVFCVLDSSHPDWCEMIL